MKRCPWCGAELKRGVSTCPSCEKTVGGKQAAEERSALSSRDAYEKKTVPIWLFVVIVAFFLFVFVLMFVN